MISFGLGPRVALMISFGLGPGGAYDFVWPGLAGGAYDFVRPGAVLGQRRTSLDPPVETSQTTAFQASSGLMSLRSKIAPGQTKS